MNNCQMADTADIESQAWFPYRCICRICRACRTKKIHRTDRIHSISYNKLYLSFHLSKDDGNGNDDARKQCSDWLNEEK